MQGKCHLIIIKNSYLEQLNLIKLLVRSFVIFIILSNRNGSKATGLISFFLFSLITMAWGLPKLPGLTFSDPTKTQHHLKSSLYFYQGYRIPDPKVVGPGSSPTDIDSNAFALPEDTVMYGLFTNNGVFPLF